MNHASDRLKSIPNVITVFFAALISTTTSAAEIEMVRFKESKSGAWASYALKEMNAFRDPHGEYWLTEDTSNKNTVLRLYYSKYERCTPKMSIRIDNVENGPENGPASYHKIETKMVIDGHTVTALPTISRYAGQSALVPESEQNSMHFGFSSERKTIEVPIRAMQKGNRVTFEISGGVINGTIRPSFSLAGFTAESNRAFKLCEADRTGRSVDASGIEL